jgi:rubrerythrin
MKTINFFPMLLGALMLTFWASIPVQAGNEQTVKDLQAAYKGESTASAKYAAYAEKAKQEGYPQIAMLFTAASKSEGIHAANHKAVLEKLGQKVLPVKPEYKVGTTKENLNDAINGEKYEVTAMYPGFLATAKAENVPDASKSFRWAMDTEKRHQQYYANALTALDNKTTASLPKVYWICPKCGNTYDVPVPESMCSFCSTGSSRFIKVQ